MIGEFAAAGGTMHVHNYESGCIMNQVSEQQQQQQHLVIPDCLCG